jgi:hypothetical protein
MQPRIVTPPAPDMAIRVPGACREHRPVFVLNPPVRGVNCWLPCPVSRVRERYLRDSRLGDRFASGVAASHKVAGKWARRGHAAPVTLTSGTCTLAEVPRRTRLG